MTRQPAPREKVQRTFDRKDASYCVYEFYPQSSRFEYHVRGAQARYVSRITLQGYSSFPVGLFLYKSGYGFSNKGVFLLQRLKSELGGAMPVTLVITSKGSPSIVRRATVTTVTLVHDDVRALLVKLGRLNEDRNSELRAEVASFLSTKFPKQLKLGAATFDDYRPGEVAALLRRSRVSEKLNDEDIQALTDLYPQLITSSFKRKSTHAEKDKLLRASKTTTDRLFLDDVIKEFEAKLRKSKVGEEDWQVFLRDKVFRFLASYVTTIDKENVSLDISYPDFVMVDVYGFIDVFEIKRHDTVLLNFDKSHDNYYWTPEVAKAISQIENYIDAVIRNAPEYVRLIKKRKTVDIKVVRPRGYIIAGRLSDLKTADAAEDFRMLSTALKNISFILYDELLERLKNLRSKL